MYFIVSTRIIFILIKIREVLGYLPYLSFPSPAKTLANGKIKLSETTNVLSVLSLLLSSQTLCSGKKKNPELSAPRDLGVAATKYAIRWPP